MFNKLYEWTEHEQWLRVLLTGSYFKPSEATMVSAKSRTSAPTSAFHQTHNCLLNILLGTIHSWYVYIIALTLASHGHRDVNIYPQLTAHKKQKTHLKTGQAQIITAVVTGVLYLSKSLSTSYSYFIHVSLYTKNSRKASIAMRENAIRDTEGSTKVSISPNVDVNVTFRLLSHLYLFPPWLWTLRSSQEL